MSWNVILSLKVVHVLDRQRPELRKEALMYVRKLSDDPHAWSTALPTPPYPTGLRAVEFYIDLQVEGEPIVETVMVRLVIELHATQRRVDILLVEFE